MTYEDKFEIIVYKYSTFCYRKRVLVQIMFWLAPARAIRYTLVGVSHSHFITIGFFYNI